MANPRQKFVAWLSGRDPAAVEQLVTDLHAVSDVAFPDVCQLANKLAATVDPKGAVAAARAEVDKRPVRGASARGQ